MLYILCIGPYSRSGMGFGKGNGIGISYTHPCHRAPQFLFCLPTALVWSAFILQTMRLCSWCREWTSLNLCCGRSLPWWTATWTSFIPGFRRRIGRGPWRRSWWPTQSSDGRLIIRGTLIYTKLNPIHGHACPVVQLHTCFYNVICNISFWNTWGFQRHLNVLYCADKDHVSLRKTPGLFCSCSLLLF